jgi:2-polyprenyl-3-methyl-5-hydroxy-6-metoxy-1,4-benzoquinol methylase
MMEPQDVRSPNGQTDGGGIQPLNVETRTQRLVNARFQAETTFWADIYDGADVLALMTQRRRDVALAWIEELQMPVQARILEVGCGAGLMAVELANRGFQVDATDAVAEMVELTSRHAEEANVSARVRAALGDVHALDFAEDTFDVVIAMGVLPWLHSPQTAIREIGRVLKPDGRLIITANNRNRLPFLLDPVYNPALRPLRRAVKGLLVRLGMRFTREGVSPRTHSLREVDALLRAGGLEKVTGCTVGFGPLTFFRRSVLPTRLQQRLHHWFQLRADHGVLGIRSLGAQYVVLARRESA